MKAPITILFLVITNLLSAQDKPVIPWNLFEEVRELGYEIYKLEKNEALHNFYVVALPSELDSSMYLITKYLFSVKRNDSIIISEKFSSPKIEEYLIRKYIEKGKSGDEIIISEIYAKGIDDIEIKLSDINYKLK